MAIFWFKCGKHMGNQEIMQTVGLHQQTSNSGLGETWDPIKYKAERTKYKSLVSKNTVWLANTTRSLKPGKSYRILC